jgi:VanZ family protein
MKIKIKSYWPATLWMTLATVAFCLPGSTLPKDDWLGVIHADKLVHIGILAIMVFLWCVPLIYRSVQKPLIKVFGAIAFAFFSYGAVMELIQHFFVSNRSFDWGDVAADAAGCLLGFFLSKRQLETV